MSENRRSCLDCALAQWHRNSKGHLHPGGEGKCNWTMAEIVLPKSRYYVGFDKTQVPQPVGGYIDRREPYTDCPTWQPKSTSH